MTKHITCDQFTDALADLLERDVSESTRAVMESHALACGECGSLVADLRKLRIDAANLPELAPSRDLWAGIAARINASVVPITAGRAGLNGRGTVWRRWAARSVAAAALVTITAGVTYYTTVHVVSTGATERALAGTPDRPTGQVPSAPSRMSESTAARIVPAEVGSVDAAVGRPGMTTRLVTNTSRAVRTPAEDTYDVEITRLHTILRQRQAQLDPSTIGVIERNLQIIDAAITQCRAALARDPASRYLMQSLDSALENKIELLRTAATLPSRS